MLHFFPDYRLQIPGVRGVDLSKAMGDMRPHKYIKRERIWVRGKPTWRYWYVDDVQRERGKEELDPHGDDEHILATEAWQKHPELRSRRKPTASITTAFLESLLGKHTSVRFSSTFERRHIQPFIDAEEKGRDVERNPVQRVAQALGMVNEAVRSIINVGTIKIATRTDPEIRDKFENGDPPRPVPASWSDDKGIVFCADGDGHNGIAGFNTMPMGAPGFGKTLTLTEEMVWHEIGKNLRANLAKKRKELVEHWHEISSNAEPKVSAAANQSWQIDFAETFAAMMSHPWLVARTSPARYTYFQRNGFVNVPPIDEMLKTSQSEWSWWDTREKTNARKLSDQMAEEMAGTPEARTVYVSEKDEFYTLTVRGRTVYFRIGPASPADEEDWRPMPSVIDPETGLPIWSDKVSQRFRAKGIVKEVYDEDGRRMDDTAAWFYLKQDETVKYKDEPLPANVEKYRALKEAGKTHGIGYQMYLALGESRGKEAETEKERKAVKQFAKEGTLQEKRGDRWQWVPAKLSAAEFHAKTPSFAYAGIKSSEIQPYVHKIDGKPVLSPAGKPILSARIYESMNPDGTKAQIVIQEAAEFSEGEEALLPITTMAKDEETGALKMKTTWERTKLDIKKHGPDLSGKALARKYRVSLEDLLRRNGKVGQYQFQDPMLASLCNPDGAPITSREDLVTRLRFAAEAQPEKWCTVAVGDEPGTNLHVKVRFDGAGSPLLVGDYWKRKLGKPNPRVSDIVEGAQIKFVDKAQELQPQKRPIQPGHPVYAQIEGEFVRAAFVSRKIDGGKTIYTVNVPEGQRAQPGVQTVSVVRAIPDNIDLDRPNIRKRRFRTPFRDVLLYADDVQVNSQGEPILGTGTVKIKLPQSGLFSFDEIARAPGVRIHEGDLILDPSALALFREFVGGFIMDEHVREKFDRTLRDARVRERAGKDQRVPLHLICDDKGVIRSDGYLKGMRATYRGAPMSLGSHQAECLQAIAQNNGRLMAAHSMGTGKTVTAIAAVKMMQNLDGKPKRCLVVVPPSMRAEWVQAVKEFTTGEATVIGAGFPGAKRMWTPPKNLQEKPPTWTDEKYHRELEKARAEAGRGYWNPSDDKNDIIVVSQDYFTGHQEELRRFGDFDGVVLDESQKGFQRDTERSRALEKLNPQLGFLLLLSGTPITNTMSVLTNYMRLLSNGQIDLGTPDEFERTHMVESAVLKASGAKTPSKMDINPTKLHEILPALHRFIHVATADDVEGKVMPSILMDENAPAPMSGVQGMLYRGYMRQMTANDRTMLSAAATLGEDERKVVSPEGQRSIRTGRSIANTPAFKPFDGSEYITFKSGDGKKRKEVALRLPDMKELQTRFRGRFPSAADVEAERVEDDQYAMMSKWYGYAFGVDYDAKLAGRKVEDVLDKDQIRALKNGEPLGNGIVAGDRILNPEYGPKGMICRGKMDAAGKIMPLEHAIRDANGKVIDRIHVPVGYRFIRNPLQAGGAFFYAAGLPTAHPEATKFESDWDTSRPVGKEREIAAPEEVGAETSEIEAEEGGEVEAPERGQRPKVGREGYDVQRNIHRRRERMMFDLVVTSDNAKCDQMESWIVETTDAKRGGNPGAQMVVFANSLDSGCRTVESKFRMMGYQDVNEALNDDNRAPEDHDPPTGKYFVTYINDQATLGDRDTNSEIFKRAKDPSGKSISMFVQRTMYGTTDGALSAGQIREAWSEDQRDKINRLFTGVEVPARVGLVDRGGRLTYEYAYDSDVSDKDKKKIRELEKKLSTVADMKPVVEEINSVYRKYLKDKKPLTDHQIHVFNNAQLMVASDAAQTGHNWGNATKLGMYDSLFSPMNEAQRAARVARILPAAITPRMRPIFEKLEDKIAKMGRSTSFSEYSGSADSAIEIVTDAIKALPTEDQAELTKLRINAPQFAESYLAMKTIERMKQLRSKVGQELRAEGRVITSAPKISQQRGVNPDGTPKYEMVYQTVKATEITEGDITSEIIEKHLQPFEREILRSRRYLKDVKRFTSSVEVPEMKTETVETVERDEETGKEKIRRRKRQVPTGAMKWESPCQAEQAQLTRGRAKQVPVERLFSAIQAEIPTETSFDFVRTDSSNLTQLGKEVREPKSAAEIARERKRREEIKAMRREEALNRLKAREARRSATKGA